ncbi:Hypothetical_protein [Hexamita inflata]|uniref:Hypothetical_protein n=1 Tax=Hexamita inflata TaxID=28002 RepID=A0AA86RD46_9EUKA|nr:Hypothetical protein HINF_LOCUS58597 [Hexamita inflata]
MLQNIIQSGQTRGYLIQMRAQSSWNPILVQALILSESQSVKTKCNSENKYRTDCCEYNRSVSAIILLCFTQYLAGTSLFIVFATRQIRFNLPKSVVHILIHGCIWSDGQCFNITCYNLENVKQKIYGIPVQLFLSSTNVETQILDSIVCAIQI